MPPGLGQEGGRRTFGFTGFGSVSDLERTLAILSRSRRFIFRCFRDHAYFVSIGAGLRRSWSAAEKTTGIVESYGAGETGLWCRAASRLTSQQLFTWRRLARQTAQSAPAILILAVEPVEPAGASPPSAGHWRFDTRPRPRLARSCRRSHAALRRAQLDEVRQTRLTMPGRWKRRHVQTGRNTRRMAAAQRCASQYVSRSARNRPHGITLLAGTPRPAKKCE